MLLSVLYRSWQVGDILTALIALLAVGIFIVWTHEDSR